MDEFIDNMSLILSVLGHKVLESSMGNIRDENTPIYYLQDRSVAKASGKSVSDGFAILKGSKIAQNVASSLFQHIIIKRKILMDKGIIDENYIFTQDWSLNSPLFAASIVVGYSINGRIAWKDKNGVSLKEQEMED